MIPLMLMAAGTAANLYGGYKSGQAKKKSAKSKLKGEQLALSQFMNGSTDAQGNKLSADPSGNWHYNLSESGKAARTLANKGLYQSIGTSPKSRAELLRDGLMNTHLANTLTARANQAAAMRTGMRTGSNLGNISRSYGAAGSANMRDAFMQAAKNAKNSALVNANVTNNLASMAQNAQAPIRGIQSNLQNMVKGLNGAVLGQQNQIASSSANPYLHGQATADFFKGIGGSMTGMGMNIQEQANFEELLKLLQQGSAK